MLRCVITETIDAGSNGTHEVVLHAVGNALALRVQIKQAKQMALGDLPTVTVVNRITTDAAGARGTAVAPV